MSYIQAPVCVCVYIYLDTCKQDFLLVLFHLGIPSALIFDGDVAPDNYFYFA